MGIATLTAVRSTCPRRSVGAVVTIDNRIIGTGYNGSLSGQPHCKDMGCVLIDNHCVSTVHAEANAILSCARHGSRVEGATLYTTSSPCINCYKTAYQAGVVRIVYDTVYGITPENILHINGATVKMECKKLDQMVPNITPASVSKHE